MSRSSALRRPPAPLPSAPAGELETAVDRERRRGRGALSNASGRFEPLARVAFDDGWQDLGAKIWALRAWTSCRRSRPR